MQKIGYEGTYLLELAGSARRRRIAGILEGAGAAENGSNARWLILMVFIEDIAGHTGQTVTLKGWLHNRRSSGKIHFLTLRDGTGFLQCVCRKRQSARTPSRAPTTCRRRARLPSPGRRGRTRERQAVSSSMSAGSRSSPRRRTIRSPRRNTARLPDGPPSPLAARAAPAGDPAHPPRVINAVRDFFNERGFILADTPIFTPAACEGTTTLFPVQYFDDENGLPDAERPAL